MPRSKEDFFRILRERPLIRNLLREKKFRWEDLQGWHMGYAPSSAERDRLIFPVNFNGVLVGYQSRALTAEGPKYKNVHGTGAFAQILYNWDRAKSYDTIVIVEGVFDAIRVGTNAVATLGTYLSAWRVDLINTLHPKKLIFMLDRDALYKAYKSSKKIFRTINTLGVVLPKKNDPASLSREAIQELLQNAKKFQLGQLSKDIIPESRPFRTLH